MHQIIIDDIIIDVVRKNIRNLHLTVYPPDGKVRITAPYRISDGEVRLFADSKYKWIKKHRQKFINRERMPEINFTGGECLYLWGQPYMLNIVPHAGYSKVVVRDEKIIDLYVKEEYTRVQREKVIDNWYRENLKKELPELIIKWQNIVGVSADDWRIKKMKTRWGTCNWVSSRIWISIELARRPVKCLEYIMVHELVHFLVRNHSSRFRAYMDKFMPSWREIRKEMNRYGI